MTPILKINLTHLAITAITLIGSPPFILTSIEIVLHNTTPEISIPASLNTKIQQTFTQYFQGQPINLTLLPHHLTGTPFQKSVWHAIANIPYGQTVSYQQLAHNIDSKAYRAVGSACKNNPLPFLIPCHRVCKANGQIGDYFYGKHLKKQLIELEKILVV